MGYCMFSGYEICSTKKEIGNANNNANTIYLAIWKINDVVTRKLFGCNQTVQYLSYNNWQNISNISQHKNSYLHLIFLLDEAEIERIVFEIL